MKISYQIIILLFVLVFATTNDAFSMTQVKNWINKVKPGLFETTDASSDAEAKASRNFTAAEMKILTSLVKREEELREKEALHEQKANALKTLSQKIEQKLDQMRTVTESFEEKRKSRKEMDEKDITRMVKYYETMDPEKTSVFFNKMDRITATHLIMRMNPRKASAVMELLDPAVAVDITERTTMFKKNRSELTVN
ncbi:hypothetical protein KKA14_17480 [bacterium]|nr:hypothetical protein [bacterium]